MLIEAQSAVLKWMQEVAMEGETYRNAAVEISGDCDNSTTANESISWWGVAEESCRAANETQAQNDAVSVSGNNETDTRVQIGDTEQVKGQAEDNIGVVCRNADGSETNLEDIPNGENTARRVRNGVSNIGEFEDRGDRAETSDGPDTQDIKQLAEDIKDLEV